MAIKNDLQKKKINFYGGKKNLENPTLTKKIQQKYKVKIVKQFFIEILIFLLEPNQLSSTKLNTPSSLQSLFSFSLNNDLRLQNSLPVSVSCQTIPSRFTGVPGSQGPRISGSVTVLASVTVPTST